MKYIHVRKVEQNLYDKGVTLQRTKICNKMASRLEIMAQLSAGITILLTC